MTSPTWMPLYIADYLADTGHLSTVEHGAYLLLIMHYWRHGALPDDDGQLARIARSNADEWQVVRPAVARLFGADWKHKRIDAELAKSSETIERRKAAGKKAADSRYAAATAEQSHAQRMPSAEQSHAQSQSQTEKKEDSEDKSSAPDDETSLFRRGKEILGPDAGGLIAKLLKAKGGKVALARAAIEMASDKENPREWIGAHLSNSDDKRPWPKGYKPKPGDKKDWPEDFHPPPGAIVRRLQFDDGMVHWDYQLHAV